MKIWLIGTIAGIINGLFGTGSGMIILPALVGCIDEIKARGATLMSVLFLSIISSIFYIKNLNKRRIVKWGKTKTLQKKKNEKCLLMC